MATSTYRDLHPGFRRVGMMLQNLSACEFRIPPRTIISNVQAAEIVLNLKAPNYTSKVLPSTEQTELSRVSWNTCLASLETELTQPTPVSLQLELGDLTLEHDMLNKVDLLGCMKWDPKVDLVHISAIKHKITLKEVTYLIRQHYRRVLTGLYDDV